MSENIAQNMYEVGKPRNNKLSHTAAACWSFSHIIIPTTFNFHEIFIFVKYAEVRGVLVQATKITKIHIKGTIIIMAKHVQLESTGADSEATDKINFLFHPVSAHK